jgi:hypothetical protein
MRQIENETPIIEDLLEQGYYIEEIRDIIIHIHEEIRRGKDIEKIFDRYSLSLNLLNDLNTL